MIFCAAEDNKNPRDQFKTNPECFSFPVFLFQALVSLLRFPPQIIGGQQLPLRVRAAQIQVCHFFRKVSLWVKSEVPRNKLLPPAQPIRQFDLARFVVCQFMGGVDLPQELLCG